MKNWPVLAAVSVLLLGSADAAPVRAQEAAASASADALLARGADALARAGRLSADFEAVTLSGPYKDARETGTVRLARPGALRIEIDRHRRRTAGDPWEATGNGSLTVRAGDAGAPAHLLTRHPKSSQYRRHEKGEPAALLGSLSPLLAGFFGGNPASGQARLIGQKEWEGVRYTVVEQEVGSEKKTLYISPGDGIARRAVIERAAGPKGGRVVREVALRNLRLGDAAAGAGRDAFVFTPPVDALPVAASGRRRADDEGTLAVGAAAPDFMAEDAGGRPVRLSEELAKGKVVVLKFWATWCWSCLQSMPETEKLAAADPGVTVLAVAMWDGRDAFRSWVRDRGPKAAPHVRFAFDPAPQGEDAATRLYGVSTTPTAFVIGRDGRITAVVTGYAGPTAAGAPSALESAARKAAEL